MSSSLGRLFTTAVRRNDIIKNLQQDLYTERDLKRLVEKFKKSCENDRFRTKSGIYEDTVRRLALAGRFRWIEEILEHQKKFRDISKEGFAARLIALYGKAGMFEHAQKVFDEMPEKKLLSFNALLGACVNSKKFDKVDGLFKELPGKLSIYPDVVSYNTVIKAYSEMSAFTSARSMLHEMEKKEVKPDLITFNTLLHGFYSTGRFLEGEEIWGKMMEKKIIPNVRSYESKLVGLASEKKTKEAVQLVGDMATNGLKLDVFCYNALIRAFVNNGELQEAKAWYNQMEKNDCSPNKMTFTILVPFLCEMNDLDFAFKLCKEIFTRKCLVDQGILQLAVDKLVKESKLEQAKKIVELAETNNYRRYKLRLPSAE